MSPLLIVVLCVSLLLLAGLGVLVQARKPQPEWLHIPATTRKCQQCGHDDMHCAGTHVEQEHGAAWHYLCWSCASCGYSSVDREPQPTREITQSELVEVE